MNRHRNHHAFAIEARRRREQGSPSGFENQSSNDSDFTQGPIDGESDGLAIPTTGEKSASPAQPLDATAFNEAVRKFDEAVNHLPTIAIVKF